MDRNLTIVAGRVPRLDEQSWETSNNDVNAIPHRTFGATEADFATSTASSRINTTDKPSIRAGFVTKPNSLRPTVYNATPPLQDVAGIESCNFDLDDIQLLSAGHPIQAATSGTLDSGLQIPVPPPTPPANSNAVQPRTEPQYACVMCPSSKPPLSDKGVCVRHVRDQHVLPEETRCDVCGQVLIGRRQVKAHEKQSGHRTGFHPARREPTPLYASEWTGELFHSPDDFINHIVQLSQRRTMSGVPVGRKLRALQGMLGQPGLRVPVAEVCQRLMGQADGWKSLLWSENTMMVAIEELSFGYAEFEPGHRRALRPHFIRTWLERLFTDGQSTPASIAEPEYVSQPNTALYSSAVFADGTGTGIEDTNLSHNNTADIARGSYRAMHSLGGARAFLAQQSGSTESQQREKRHLSFQSRLLGDSGRPCPAPPMLPEVLFERSLPEEHFWLPRENNDVQAPSGRHLIVGGPKPPGDVYQPISQQWEDHDTLLEDPLHRQDSAVSDQGYDSIPLLDDGMFTEQLSSGDISGHQNNDWHELIGSDMDLELLSSMGHSQLPETFDDHDPRRATPRKLAHRHTTVYGHHGDHNRRS